MKTAKTTIKLKTEIKALTDEALVGFRTYIFICLDLFY